MNQAHLPGEAGPKPPEESSAWPACGICGEICPDGRSLVSHEERHKPAETEEPGSTRCPRGCGRPFLRPSDLAEHVERCGGEPPISGTGQIVSAKPAPAMSAERPEGPRKEKIVAKCKVCGKKFESGKGLGGHMSKSHPGKAAGLAGPKKPAAARAERAPKKPRKKAAAKPGPTSFKGAELRWKGIGQKWKVKPARTPYKGLARGFGRVDGVSGSPGTAGATGVHSETAADRDGILGMLKARSAELRAKADAIDRDIEEFTEKAKAKYL